MPECRNDGIEAMRDLDAIFEPVDAGLTKPDDAGHPVRCRDSLTSGATSPTECPVNQRSLPEMEPGLGATRSSEEAPPRDCRHEWPPDLAGLVAWFLDEGQHRLPKEPFRIAPWLRVADPAIFRQSLLFDISRGPEGPRCRYGALHADLRRLHDLFSVRRDIEDCSNDE